MAIIMGLQTSPKKYNSDPQHKSRHALTIVAVHLKTSPGLKKQPLISPHQPKKSETFLPAQRIDAIMHTRNERPPVAPWVCRVWFEIR